MDAHEGNGQVSFLGDLSELMHIMGRPRGGLSQRRRGRKVPYAKTKTWQHRLRLFGRAGFLCDLGERLTDAAIHDMRMRIMGRSRGGLPQRRRDSKVRISADQMRDRNGLHLLGRAGLPLRPNRLRRYRGVFRCI